MSETLMTLRVYGVDGEVVEVEGWDLNIETPTPDVSMFLTGGDTSSEFSFQIDHVIKGHYEDLCRPKWRIWLRHRLQDLSTWLMCKAHQIAPVGSKWVAE